MNFLQRTADCGYESEYYYIEQARTMIIEKKSTSYVKHRHLEEITESVVSFRPNDLSTAIKTKYLIVREALNAAVPQLLERIPDKELVEEVKRAREENATLKYVAAFYELPTFNGIRDLRTEHMGKLMTISGTVTRTTEVKPELLVGTFKCNECGSEVTDVEQQFKVTMRWWYTTEGFNYQVATVEALQPGW